MPVNFPSLSAEYLANRMHSYEQLYREAYRITPRITRRYNRPWDPDRVSPPVLTPVKEPCVFLGRRTRNSEVTGLPQGTTQTCTHPAHDELQLLQTNVKEILRFLQEFTEKWVIQNSDIAMITANLVIHAEAAALDLPNPAEYVPKQNMELIAEMRALTKELSDRLYSSRKTKEGSCGYKSFTDATRK